MNFVECIPNISIGKNTRKTLNLIKKLKKIDALYLLHYDIGHDTNRTVVSFVVDIENLNRVSMSFIDIVFNTVDMREHKGIHPRIGAIDVFPFVAIGDTDKQLLNKQIELLARKINKQYKVPVYLYAESAKDKSKYSLHSIRKGEYENINNKLKELEPDFYTHKDSENLKKFGIITLGQREFMLAYNVSLNTKDVELCNNIAKIIRETGDGKNKGLFKGLKSIAWYIPEYKHAQVSCNIMDYKTSPLHMVYEKIKDIALEKGIKTIGSEIIGLVPLEALIMAGKFYTNQRLNEQEYINIAIKHLNLNKIKKFIPEKRIIEYLLNEFVGVK